MKKLQLKIEYINIDLLTPYENNTRKHTENDVEKIKNSISEFGNNDPIGVWGKKNIIVEGHGRYMALKELGYTEVPIIRLDHLNDEQRRAYGIAHNKTAENSVWDIEKLDMELADLPDIDFTKFGFENLKMEEQELNNIENNENDLLKCPACSYVGERTDFIK